MLLGSISDPAKLLCTSVNVNQGKMHGIRTHSHFKCKRTLNHSAKFVTESRCCHLNFRYRACFKQGVPRYSGNYRVMIMTYSQNGMALSTDRPLETALIFAVPKLLNILIYL